MPQLLSQLSNRIRFDRNELAGAFGDMGTDLPLIIGIIAASDLDAASVLIVYGLMQFFSGIWYGIPMPVQPLKAFAAIVIAQKVTSPVIFGGGLAIGIVMLFLSLTGLINWLARVVPKPVVRGIQLGLGLQLATLALKEYVQTEALTGYMLAGICFLIVLLLYGNRKFPPALFIIAAGTIYALLYKLKLVDFSNSFNLHLPAFRIPSSSNIWTGFLLLALPQIPLSLGNSILATNQIVKDYYPEKNLGVRKISFTYSLMNLVSPFLGGIPVCHGSGGLAGHYAFGARTGGSVLTYGSLFLVLGLFFSEGFATVIQIFPMPVLGTLLFFEGLALAVLVRDVALVKADLVVSVLVGLMCIGLPYGYLIGMLSGTLVYYLMQNKLTNFGQ
ncbi:MAG: transporter [Cytophagales bacterium CG18_big_fil_WC_8_21_14_2_50_42_9]|nr:MAG: transporter [Cytophagales bacterium CG18_big_fil_WC_8_21_14_2_50_42_9]